MDGVSQHCECESFAGRIVELRQSSLLPKAGRPQSGQGPAQTCERMAVSRELPLSQGSMFSATMASTMHPVPGLQFARRRPCSVRGGGALLCGQGCPWALSWGTAATTMTMFVCKRRWTMRSSRPGALGLVAPSLLFILSAKYAGAKGRMQRPRLRVILSDLVMARGRQQHVHIGAGGAAVALDSSTCLPDAMVTLG